jgi:chloramphenicol O-acetyltransferase type A
MRVIDLESWPRREHFRLYSGMEFPHVGICVQVDITQLWANRARVDASPTIVLAYVVTKAANRVPQFRQRIRGERVVEHDVVHPLITVLGGDDLFGVLTLAYDPRFATFAADAEEHIAEAKDHASVAEFPHDQEGEFKRDDLLSITVVPWLSFTGFSLTRRPQVDTIPLLAWGKVLEEGDRNLLPLFVNVHHSLVDGLHIARFVEHIEEEARQLAASFE